VEIERNGEGCLIETRSAELHGICFAARAIKVSFLRWNNPQTPLPGKRPGSFSLA
jgi:hypothetical protein